MRSGSFLPERFVPDKENKNSFRMDAAILLLEHHEGGLINTCGTLFDRGAPPLDMLSMIVGGPLLCFCLLGGCSPLSFPSDNKGRGFIRPQLKALQGRLQVFYFGEELHDDRSH